MVGGLERRSTAHAERVIVDLALRAAEYFGLPVKAIFSRRPFTLMSEQLYAEVSPDRVMTD